MVEQSLLNPTEPVVEDDGTYGGFAAIAAMLNKQNPERPVLVSRQLVHKWWTHRKHNSFPEAVLVRTESGAVKNWFSLDAVDEWHRLFRSTRKADAHAEMQLFQVNRQGLAVN